MAIGITYGLVRERNGIRALSAFLATGDSKIIPIYGDYPNDHHVGIMTRVCVIGAIPDCHMGLSWCERLNRQQQRYWSSHYRSQERALSVASDDSRRSR